MVMMHCEYVDGDVVAMKTYTLILLTCLSSSKLTLANISDSYRVQLYNLPRARLAIDDLHILLLPENQCPPHLIYPRNEQIDSLHIINILSIHSIYIKRISENSLGNSSFRFLTVIFASER